MVQPRYAILLAVLLVAPTAALPTSSAQVPNSPLLPWNILCSFLGQNVEQSCLPAQCVAAPEGCADLVCEEAPEDQDCPPSGAPTEPPCSGPDCLDDACDAATAIDPCPPGTGPVECSGADCLQILCSAIFPGRPCPPCGGAECATFLCEFILGELCPTDTGAPCSGEDCIPFLCTQAFGGECPGADDVQVGAPSLRAAFAPSSASAADHAASKVVVLAVGGGSLPASAVPFDRILVGAPAGFTTAVTAVRFAGAPLVARGDLIDLASCGYDNSVELLTFASDDADASTTGPTEYLLCKHGERHAITLNRPARGEVAVDLLVTKTPTVARAYGFDVRVSETLGGADDLRAPAPAPDSPNGTGALDPVGLNATATFTILPAAGTEIFFRTAPASTAADVNATFVAKLRDVFANELSTSIAYSVASGSGAVNATGVFAPELVGTTTILASAAGVTNQTSITVTPGAIDHVMFTGTPALTTDADTPASFVAVAMDKFHNARTDAVTYAIGNGSGAIHATTGLFTPRLVGQTMLNASAGGKNATHNLTVTPGALHHVAFTTAPGATTADAPVTFAAIARDQFDNDRLDGVAYAIGSGSGAIGGSTGVFTPDRVGTTAIRATAGAKSAIVEILVSEGELDHVMFTQAAESTDADTPKTFVALAMDKNHNPLGNTVTYAKVSGSGAIGEATGLFTPELVGPTVLEATAGDETAQATIVVTAGALHHVTFTTAPATTNADTPKTFLAIPEDQFGNDRADVVTYSIASGSGAVGSASGVFTPRLVGPTTIKAAAGTRSATTDIAVAVGALHDVAFTSAPGATDADTPKTFVAIARDQHGNPRTDAVTYEKVSGSGAIAATSGAFTPALAGSTVLKATAGAKSATTTIVVSPGAPERVAFTTTHATTDADTPRTFAASAFDKLGNARSDAITYEVKNGSGDIASSGRFTPKLIGNTTLRASLGSLSATTTIAVTPGAPAVLNFSIAPADVMSEAPFDLLVTATDAAGNPTKLDTQNVTLVGSDAVGSRDLGSLPLVEGGASFAGVSLRRAGEWTLVASLPGGQSATVVIRVVAPTPPPPPPTGISFAAAPAARFEVRGALVAGSPVELVGSATGSIVSYAWDFGDGTQGTGSAVSHTWASPGSYSVRLLVRDDAGQDGRTLQLLEVQAPAAAAAPAPTSTGDGQAPDTRGDASGDDATAAPPTLVPAIRAIAPQGIARSPATVSFELDYAEVVYWRLPGRGDWETTNPATIAGDGPVTIEYYALSAAGRTITHAVTLRLDAFDPEIGEIDAPATLGVGEPLALSVQIEDFSDVAARAELVPVAGGEAIVVALERTAEGYRANAEAAIPAGEYRIDIVAADAVGREARTTLEAPLVVADEEQAIEESSLPAAEVAKPSQTPGPGLLLGLGALALAALALRRRRT